MDKINIVFEDDVILVVDKPAGMVVNRAATIKDSTLQDELFDYFKATLPKGSDPNIADRAGIVHRLDRETSGLLLVAKTQEAFDWLQKQFADRQVKKEYFALVHGYVREDRGSIAGAIGRIGKFGKFGVVDRRSIGREAKTDYKVETRYEISEDVLLRRILEQEFSLSKAGINYLKTHARDYSLLSIFPKTGRTHQVRVHLKSIGHPVVSDLIYTPKKLLKFDLLWCPRLFLHACALEVIHPATKKPIKFTRDLPRDLESALLNLTIDPSTLRQDLGLRAGN